MTTTVLYFTLPILSIDKGDETNNTKSLFDISIQFDSIQFDPDVMHCTRNSVQKKSKVKLLAVVCACYMLYHDRGAYAVAFAFAFVT